MWLCVVSLTVQPVSSFSPISLPSPSHLPVCFSPSLSSLSPTRPSVPASPQPMDQTHPAVLCVQAPNVGAGPQAEVGVVAFGLVDPLPAQVLAEVNVELPHTAVLLCGTEAGGAGSGGRGLPRAGPAPPHQVWCVCVSPWLPPSTVYILVSLASPVIITAMQ